MDNSERLMCLKELLDRKCNLMYDLELQELQSIDSEISKLYNVGESKNV